MTRFTGTQYEGKARKELQQWDIFSVGLQPDASPDLVIPKYNIGIEVKSTRLNKFYPSKNPQQYEYLKNKFPEDWPGYSAYYMIYFIKSHNWMVFSVWSKPPFKANEGMSVYDFISKMILNSNLVYNNIKYKNEVIKR
jgi:hypothetical protein